MNTTQPTKIDLLTSMGFTGTETKGVFEHKMFEHGQFDFSATSNDIFWLMDKIFKTAIKAGESIKAEKIRKELKLI